MNGLLSAILSTLKKKKFKCEELLVSGSFVAKTEVVFLQACAGGGGGDPVNIGGASGAGCDWLAVPTTIGQSYSVVIGAGGAVSGDGGATSFGSLVLLPGGQAGGRGQVNYGGLKSPQTYNLASGAIMSDTDAHTIGQYISGANTWYAGASYYGSGNHRYPSGGPKQGAGGMFGPGGNNTAAAANSGAGGGINKAGGSGRMRIYYEG